MKLTVIIIASCLLTTSALAQASPVSGKPQEIILSEEVAKVACKLLVTVSKEAIDHGGTQFKDVNRDQWQFLRGVSVVNPGTPAGIPPGDKAEISDMENGSAMVVFVDGDMACFPMRLPKQAVDYFNSIGRGDTIRLHPDL